MLVDLPSSEGAATARELSELGGGEVVFAPADVTSADDVSAALDQCEAAFGAPVNVAVNCAGIGYAARTIHPKRGAHDLDAFSKVMHVNTTGTFNVLRLAAERMASAERQTVTTTPAGALSTRRASPRTTGRLGRLPTPRRRVRLWV